MITVLNPSSGARLLIPHALNKTSNTRRTSFLPSRKSPNRKWCQQAEEMYEERTKTHLEHVKDTQWIQKQHRIHITEEKPVPRPFNGIPVVKVDPPDDDEVWWSCQFCEFEIKHGETGNKYHKRLHHLDKVHNNKTYLNRSHLSHPQRAVALQSANEKSWLQ